MQANLVHQTTEGTGTGTLTLALVTGKRGFAAAFGTGSENTFNYFASSRTEDEWEVGIGYMSDATTLVRDEVIESSNANAAVNFSAGVKDVTNDIPADEQVRQGELGNAAALDVGTSAGTVAAGDDGRFSDAREWTADTVSQEEAEAGTATTRRAWTAERVAQAISALGGGGVPYGFRPIIYTSSGTWTKPSSASFVGVWVWCIGGGGGGGGSGTTNGRRGAGGGGGAAGWKFIAAAALGSTETVTVGAPGSGGAEGSNNGAAGTASSFGSHMTAGGGGGGVHGASEEYSDGGTAGTISGADIGRNGSRGAGSGPIGEDFLSHGGAAGGGVDYWGVGATALGPGGILGQWAGMGGQLIPNSTNQLGTPGYAFGGGGTGASRNNANRSGGDGAPGGVVVYELYEVS